LETYSVFAEADGTYSKKIKQSHYRLAVAQRDPGI